MCGFFTVEPFGSRRRQKLWYVSLADSLEATGP
jgi:hypothetical protein